MPGLPQIIPLFPLPNVVLFPGVRLPLHIFEPRYREMVADAARSHGLIGMVLLRSDWQSSYHASPEIFDVGCAGTIGDLSRLPDGRFDLVLEGLSEFRVRREMRWRSYRQAEVRWCGIGESELRLEAKTMEALRRLLLGYLGPRAHQAWNSLVERRGMSGFKLINYLCFHLDVTPLEKQTMLEAMAQRVTCLLDVLTFKIQERKAGSGGAAGGSQPVQ